MSQQMPGEFLQQFPRVIGKVPAGRPHTSWLATMKNDLSYHKLGVEDATERVWTGHSGGYWQQVELHTELSRTMMMTMSEYTVSPSVTA